ncbi:MAG: DUF808 family protein, partial [Bacteroidetes bacterium]|nr:DUF808 family protein [Bacteroidota bacterium]
VSVVALLATVGVYGIVALIVRMDDFGLKLMERSSSSAKALGRFLVQALPKVIKTLGVVGTIALILVSGGIFTHNVPFIHDLFHNWIGLLADTLTGLLIGTIVFLIVEGVKKLKSSF